MRAHDQFGQSHRESAVSFRLAGVPGIPGWPIWDFCARILVVRFVLARGEHAARLFEDDRLVLRQSGLSSDPGIGLIAFHFGRNSSRSVRDRRDPRRNSRLAEAAQPLKTNPSACPIPGPPSP
jgi:hypothetical protein